MRSPNVERNKFSFLNCFPCPTSYLIALKGEHKVDWVAIQTTFDDRLQGLRLSAREPRRLKINILHFLE